MENPGTAGAAAPGTLRVALVQLASPDAESVADRIARVEGLLRRAAGADLCVLPELWNAGYFSFDEYRERAETLDGPTVTMVRRVARELGCAIHLGSLIELGGDGALTNTAVLVSADGEIAQLYRKIHVFGYESDEARLLTPGDTLSVTPMPFGRTASTTCYDLRFPGLWQQLSERGAEIVIVPAAWPAARRAHWRLLSSARAVEHQVWVIACNAVGEQRGVELGGHSRIVDPMGGLVAECGEGEEIRIVDIVPGLTAEARREFPVIADRLSSLAYADLRTNWRDER